MQIARYEAGVVTNGNKLFVFCGIGLHYNFLKTSEVYDSISQKFTFIASSFKISWSSNLFCTYFNGNNVILIYGNYYWFYNITTNTWSDKYCLEFEK